MEPIAIDVYKPALTEKPTSFWPAWRLFTGAHPGVRSISS